MMQQRKLAYISIAVVLAILVGCTPSSKADLEANKEVVRRFADVLNSAEFDLLDEIVVSDFVRHSQATPGVQVQSLDEFKELQKQFLASMSDQKVAIEFMIAEGDYVAAYATYSGTQDGPMGAFPATGKKAESKFISIFRFEEGKIAELWVEMDNIAFLTQLGHFPPPQAVGE
jgi:steroid delta-isomerase-like uncharacterized protein